MRACTSYVFIRPIIRPCMSLIRVHKSNMPDLMWIIPDLMSNMRKHKLGMLNIGGHKNSHGKHKKT